MRFLPLTLSMIAAAAAAAEPQPKPLRLELISIREARTSVPSRFGREPSVTEWTIITAKANSRDLFGGGNAFESELFVGDIACLSVWRELRVTCIAPRIPEVGRLAVWGPVAMPIGQHTLPEQVLKRQKTIAANEKRVFKLEGVPVRPFLTAKDINALIAQLDTDI